MSIKNKIAGIALMVVGVAVWSIDYFILKVITSIGTWLAELTNAPVGVGIGVIIIITILLLGVLTLVAFIGALVFWWGLCAMEEK